MNRVTIETAGPVMENLCRIEVADDYASETIHLDNADVEQAREEGTLLELVAENLGSGTEILRAALANGSPVSLDGEDVDAEALSALFAMNADGDMTARP